MYRGYKISIGESLFIEEKIFKGAYFQQKRSVNKFDDYQKIGRSLFTDVVNQADELLLEYISEDGLKYKAVEAEEDILDKNFKLRSESGEIIVHMM